MKLKNFFYLLLALPLAFAACEEDPDVQPVVLKLTSEATMDFDANGGTGAITYTLENAVEGIKLKATCADAWVEDLTAGEQVTFTVVKNETTEARETKIVVSYDKASFEVTVKQAAKAADEGNKDDDNKDEGNKDGGYEGRARKAPRFPARHLFVHAYPQRRFSKIRTVRKRKAAVTER